jgi:hypothetical protein
MTTARLAMLLCVGALVLAGWTWRLHGRTAKLIAERAELEEHWKMVSWRLREAEQAREVLVPSLERSKRLKAEAPGMKWTWALRTVVTAVPTAVALADLHANAGKERGTCHITVGGHASGPTAREAADRFRASIEKDLAQDARARAATVRFARLEEEQSSPAGPAGTRFTILAKLTLKEQPVPGP